MINEILTNKYTPTSKFKLEINSPEYQSLDSGLCATLLSMEEAKVFLEHFYPENNLYEFFEKREITMKAKDEYEAKEPTKEKEAVADKEPVLSSASLTMQDKQTEDDAKFEQILDAIHFGESTQIEALLKGKSKTILKRVNDLNESIVGNIIKVGEEALMDVIINKYKDIPKYELNSDSLEYESLRNAVFHNSLKDNGRKFLGELYIDTDLNSSGWFE